MANAAQLKALIDSHGSGDDSRFRAVAMQIAASAAKKGQQRLADQLRELIASIPRQSAEPRSLNVGPARAVPIVKPPANLDELIVASFPETRIADMVLPEAHRRTLQHLVAEFHDRDQLESHGLAPRRRILLAGPPGCGKTMTAAALAGQCKLPLVEIQLHCLMSRYLGETASRLFQIFDFMKDSPGVYLFDEFDAIGAVRNASGDVGEIRRVLNSLLQFIERYEGQGFIVAATNLPDMLDHALHRRFDVVLRYKMPQPGDARRLICNRLAAFDVNVSDWETVQQAAGSLCHAEIVKAAESAARRTVLESRSSVTTEDLTDCLTERSDAWSRSAPTTNVATQRNASPSPAGRNRTAD